MAKTVRRRSIEAPPEAVWAVVSDPRQLPYWWPNVIRTEDVGGSRFTIVASTRRGKQMRMDQRLDEIVPMVRVTWSQDIPGTPFERMLAEWRTAVSLQPDGVGTMVTIEEVQRLRGSFGLGSPLQMRPARRRVNGALDALADALKQR